MDPAPSLEAVCQAIHALYHTPDIGGKEKASAWLGTLQRSVHAWTISDELLRCKVDVETCYFAAQTMRSKIQYAFHELPVSAQASLKDSILEHIGHVNEATNQVIITQLCLALADLALQMATWTNAVTELITRFGDNIHHVPPLLEILTVMPEEVNSRSLRLGANRRTEIHDNFNDAAPLVLQLLCVCMDNYSSDPRILVRVMRCLGSWFNIGALPTTDVAHSKLLTNVFQALISPQTPSMVHEAATDSVCAALLMADKLTQNVHSHPHADLAKALHQGVLTLAESYHMSVAQEDIDKSINYSRIFTELAESHLEVMVERQRQGLSTDTREDLGILDLILICVGHHDYEVAEISFNFWYRLSEKLYKEDDPRLNDIFGPYIERLIIALCKHCQLEPDHEGNPDEGDDFSEFRFRVSDLIKDVVFVVGSANSFRQLFKNLQAQSNQATWDVFEASLFVMSAMAKSVSPTENEIVCQVVEAILSLPDNVHTAVKHTSTQLVGELCEWIEKHPQTLEPILNFLLSRMQQPKLSNVAATALHKICSTCRDQMGAHFQGIIQIIQAMDTFNISNDAAIGLLKGASLILSRMPHDKIADGLRQLCVIQLTPLAQVVQNAETVKDGSKGDPTIWLDRMAAIFRNLNVTVTNGQLHPCQPLVQEMWPLLSSTCSKYQTDVRIIERCCRCIRFMIRCVGKQSAPMLEPLVKQIVQLYQLHQHSCFLYLGSILVDEYGNEEGCVHGLLEMLHAFCGPTFKILDETDGLRGHPDTVDDLFRLCTRFIQRATVPFLQSAVLKSILNCAMVACTIEHRDANASVMKFIEDVVKCSRTKEDSDDFELRRSLVRIIINENGQQLVSNIINACIFCLPSYMVPDAADVIFELMLFDRPAVCVWLEVTLKALPMQSSGGSITATHKQLTDFHKGITSAENDKMVKTAIQEFTRLFR